MNLPTRQPPRFVPTLTEVVEPPAPGAATADHEVDVDALVASICQQMQPVLARRLQQESEPWLRATLAQHLRDVNESIQSDIEFLVRRTLMTALKAQNRPIPDDAPDN